MSELYDWLQSAAKNGEVVRIVYLGGSQPGSVREIVPLRVTEREVRARDVASGIDKLFLLARIRCPSGTTVAPEYDLNRPREEDAEQSLVKACEDDVPELQQLGWHVELSESGISLHRYFKNGKPRKGADVGISIYDEHSSRPYYVYGPSLASARTFGRLSRAIELFAEEAVTHAPKNRT